MIGKVRVHPQLAAGDARGAPFQRLHDAVQAGADRLALEVAVAEAIHAFATLDDGAGASTRGRCAARSSSFASGSPSR